MNKTLTGYRVHILYMPFCSFIYKLNTYFEIPAVISQGPTRETELLGGLYVSIYIHTRTGNRFISRNYTIVTWLGKFEIYILATPTVKIPTLGQASHLPFSCKLVLEQSQLDSKQYIVDFTQSLAGSLSPSSQ